MTPTQKEFTNLLQKYGSIEDLMRNEGDKFDKNFLINLCIELDSMAYYILINEDDNKMSDYYEFVSLSLNEMEVFADE